MAMSFEQYWFLLQLLWIFQIIRYASVDSSILVERSLLFASCSSISISRCSHMFELFIRINLVESPSASNHVVLLLLLYPNEHVVYMGNNHFYS